jgi:hypothetical protein
LLLGGPLTERSKGQHRHDPHPDRCENRHDQRYDPGEKGAVPFALQINERPPNEPARRTSEHDGTEGQDPGQW